MVEPVRTSRTGGALLWSAVFGLSLGGLGCLPVGVRHFYHLMTQPEGLYDPIVVDHYFLDRAGASRSYVLEPRFHDYYELGLRGSDPGIPASYRFTGRARLEFVLNDEIVETRDVTSIVSRVHAEGDSRYSRKVALSTFELPFWCGEDAVPELRITVERPDAVDPALTGSMEIYVAVSATP